MSDQLRLQRLMDSARVRDAAAALARFKGGACGCSTNDMNPNVPNEAAYLEGKIKACGFNYSRDPPVSSGVRTAQVQKAAEACGPQKPRGVIPVQCPVVQIPKPVQTSTRCGLPNTPFNPVLPA